jgi:RNA polymerase sigma-70 factor (ECF subfamily)
MFQMQQDNANDQAKDRAWLAQAMNALPTDLREVLVLTLAEDMTQAEAGAALGIPAGTVSWRVSEAKKHLRAFAQSEECYP